MFNIRFVFFCSVLCLHQLAEKLRKKQKCAFHFSSRFKNKFDIWWKYISEFRCCFRLRFYCWINVFLFCVFVCMQFSYPRDIFCFLCMMIFQTTSNMNNCLDLFHYSKISFCLNQQLNAHLYVNLYTIRIEFSLKCFFDPLKLKKEKKHERKHAACSLSVVLTLYISQWYRIYKNKNFAIVFLLDCDFMKLTN